jgi:hypothetical protein
MFLYFFAELNKTKKQREEIKILFFDDFVGLRNKKKQKKS